MRFILAILFVCFSQAASANLTALIEAIKDNDLDRAAEILARENEYGLPFVSVNGIDEEGRTPVFYASSPEMLTLLLDRGARVYESGVDANRPRVDKKGMNALHVLMAETAPRLFQQFPDDVENMARRIEATGYFLMRLAVLNEYQARPRIRLETQQDHMGRLPGAFVQGEGPFFDRLNNRYIVQHLPPPEGGFREAYRRKLAKERELLREFEQIRAAERRVEEEQRQRQEARMQAILDAELTIQAAPAPVVAPALTIAMPSPRRRPGFEGRRSILSGPQWWIDQQEAKQNARHNSNNE